jgi:hypothetical protein
MADACFTARATTCDHVCTSIAKLALPITAGGQYNHEDATTFIAGIRRILRETYNPGDPGNGMDKLCVVSNAIACIKSTSAVTAKTVLDDAKHIAIAASTTSGTTIPPAIDMRSDAQDEADRLNLINQAVIGAKEGTDEAITKKVGTDVTDAILKTADGSNFKSIDDWQLEDVLAAIIQGADRSNTADVLNQLLAIIQFVFDFCKKVDANMELLRSKVGHLTSYGITIDNTQLALILLANIDTAASNEWGREFRPTLQTIRRRYAYNHVHDTTSISDMFQELAGANGVQKLADAPAPSGNANAVNKQVSLLTQLLEQQTSDSNGEASEYTAAEQLDSNSSNDKSRRGRHRGRNGGGGSGSRRNNCTAGRGNCSRSRHPLIPCPHCKKFK